MAKFCTNCGNELDDNAVMCPKCGMSLESKNNNTSNSEQKHNGLEIVGFILSFIIPLVGFILSIIGLSKAKKNNEKTGLGVAGVIISGIGIIISTIVILISISTVSNVIEVTKERSEQSQRAIEEAQREMEEAQDEMNDIYEDYLEKYTNGDY